MYATIKGTFENGQLILEEPAPTMQKTKVIVTFLPDENVEEQPRRKGVRIGSLANLEHREPGSLKKLGELEGKKYSIPDDFNEPLDDLKEYM